MSGAKKRSILVIDDDPNFRELISMVGDTLGLRVLQAADCREGLGVIERERDQLQLILLDYFIPGMPPIECSTRLTEKAPGVLIILVTAAVDPAQRAAELHLNRWLSKPFNIEDLERLLQLNLRF